MNDGRPAPSPSGAGRLARMEKMHWTATGPIACKRAVVWVQPRGPPKRWRTSWVKPRAMDSPISWR
jgi:hypothetical protein